MEICNTHDFIHIVVRRKTFEDVNSYLIKSFMHRMMIIFLVALCAYYIICAGPGDAALIVRVTK